MSEQRTPSPSSLAGDAANACVRFVPAMLKVNELQRARPAPSPLVGEGWGEGWFWTRNLLPPLSLSLPHKGGGNAVEPLVASPGTCSRARIFSQPARRVQP